MSLIRWYYRLLVLFGIIICKEDRVYFSSWNKVSWKRMLVVLLQTGANYTCSKNRSLCFLRTLISFDSKQKWVHLGFVQYWNFLVQKVKSTSWTLNSYPVGCTNNKLKPRLIILTVFRYLYFIVLFIFVSPQNHFVSSIKQICNRKSWWWCCQYFDRIIISSYFVLVHSS